MGLQESLEKRIITFVFGIAVGTLSLYLLLVQILGLSIVRRENFLSMNEVGDKYMSKDEVHQKFQLKSEIRDCSLTTNTAKPNAAGGVKVSASLPDIRPREPVGSQPSPEGKDTKPPTEKASVIPPALQDDSEQGEFSLQIQHCMLRSSRILCQLTVTNDAEDRQLMLAGRVYPPSSRMFDPEGNEYQADFLALGANESTGGAQIVVPHGVPIKAQISFEGVPRDTKSISLLEVHCTTFSPKYNWKALTFRFHNVQVVM